jgi:hypothetical protein
MISKEGMKMLSWFLIIAVIYIAGSFYLAKGVKTCG